MLFALLLFIGLATSQSYICDRGATYDTYCNGNNTRTTTFYSGQVNILTTSGYQPFEDVAFLEYKEDHFELSYEGKTARIDLFAVVGGKETAMKDTELKAEPVVIKQRGGFEYGVTLDNADKVEALGFRIGGDEIKNVKYDFSDTVTDKTSLEMLDSKTALVRNTAAAKQLTIDPTITLNESNAGNVADSYVKSGVPTTNYGTSAYMDVQTANVGDGNDRAFLTFNLSALNQYIGVGVANITDAELRLYIIHIPAASRTLQAYNVSNSWTETGITWNNQPAADTLQQAIAGGTTNNVWLQWAVTNAAIASYAQANQNMSIMIRDSSESSATTYYYRFPSKENTTAEQRPQLIITYTFTCPLSSVNITTYNESSSSQSVYFNLIVSNSTSTFTLNNINQFNTSYCNSSFPVGSVTISISNSSFYSPRYYYPTLTYGSGYNLSAYLLPLTDTYPITTSFILISGSLTITTATVTVQKQVNGAWTTMAQKQVDSAGSAAFNLDYQTPYYLITTASGYATRYDYITPISNIYYLTMQSSASGVIPFWEYFNQYTYACTIDNSSWPASMLINCSVNDSSGHFDTVTLTVQAIGYYGSQTLCTNSSSTANFTVSCNLISPPNQTITYQLSVNTHSDPGFYTIVTGIIDWFLAPTAKYGTYGILIAAMITIGLGLIGIFNPALGIAGAAVGLLLSSTVFQLINIPTAAMMAILAVCVILIYRIRT
jgi:hypothetical protein